MHQAEWRRKEEEKSELVAAAEAKLHSQLAEVQAQLNKTNSLMTTEKEQNELLMQTLHDTMRDKRFDYGKLEQRLKRCAVENAKFKALLVGPVKPHSTA